MDPHNYFEFVKYIYIGTTGPFITLMNVSLNNVWQHRNSAAKAIP
jgi:hypothetical protein